MSCNTLKIGVYDLSAANDFIINYTEDINILSK